MEQGSKGQDSRVLFPAQGGKCGLAGAGACDTGVLGSAPNFAPDLWCAKATSSLRLSFPTYECCPRVAGCVKCTEIGRRGQVHAIYSGLCGSLLSLLLLMENTSAMGCCIHSGPSRTVCHPGVSGHVLLLSKGRCKEPTIGAVGEVAHLLKVRRSRQDCTACFSGLRALHILHGMPRGCCADGVCVAEGGVYIRPGVAGWGRVSVCVCLCVSMESCPAR